MKNNSLYIYQVENLPDARKYIADYETCLVVTNARGTTRYYGMLVLDYMFKTLQQEFTQIQEVIVEVKEDHAALFTAIKLGYKQINYTGNSEAARAMLLDLKAKAFSLSS